MDRLSSLLGTYWLTYVLLAGALVLGLRWRRARQRGSASWPLAVSAALLGLLGVGGLLGPLLVRLQVVEDPTSWAWWVAGVPLALLFVAVLVVVSTGRWSARLGYGLCVLALLGLGGLSSAAISRAGTDAFRVVLRLEAMQPWWLLLLALIPLLIYYSYRSLAGLGPVRRWLALGLRSALVLLLILALAEVRLRHPNENLTVLFLVDRSLSVPEE